jgi:exodeoxyribonuclease VII small subunit
MSGDLGFEEALQALEERVRKLEGGDVPLEQSLQLFEQGVELARTCHEQLEAAEQRVASLVRGADGIEERPIDS